jgi:hypothetical protein
MCRVADRTEIAPRGYLSALTAPSRRPSLRYAAVIGTYASALLICAAAILLGRAVCVLAGHEGSSWLAPAVGLAALMIVCEVAVRLPGHGWTAVAAVVILCAAAVYVAGRRSAAWPSPADALPATIVILLIVSIPFVASTRVGVLGISSLNDTHWHLFLAEGLRRPALQPLDTYGPGYPVGPHAIAATFAQLLGSDVDKTLTGVLIATPVLTGLAALGALGDVRRVWRWLVAVLAAVAYMLMASYAESAFKEPIMALLMLGLVVVLQVGCRDRFTRPLAVVVPAAVLIAGVIYDYSYPGLAWPVAITACFLALELVVGGAWRRLKPIAAQARGSAAVLVLGVLLLVALVAPDLGRIHTFWLSNGGTSVGTVGGVSATSLANLVGPLRSLEGLNLWLNGDFRFVPHDALQAGALAGFALVVLLYAIVSALQRGDLAWVAGILGCGLVYLYAKHSQSPYVASKALAVPAPLVMLGCGGALVRQLDGAALRSIRTLAFFGVLLAFCFFAFKSSYLVLRDAEVGPVNHTQELRSLRPLLHNQPTLVLFYDDYVKWELLGVRVSSPLLASTIPAPIRPAKPWSYGQPLDFDSVDAATLNRFDYVITTRTTAQSEPPPNFHLVGSSASYEVWHRVGPTEPRLVLAEAGRPGAILDCRTALGRRLSHQRGIARTRPEPRYFNIAPLAPTGSEQVTLNLPAGDWDLSLPFLSQQNVTVRGPGLNVTMPPNLDRPGEIWPVGRIHSRGAPVMLTVKMAPGGPFPSGTQFFTPQQMVATSTVPPRTVPLASACGRYVDWYHIG